MRSLRISRITVGRPGRKDAPRRRRITPACNGAATVPEPGPYRSVTVGIRGLRVLS